MVCVTGKKVENGRCGESGTIDAIDARGTSVNETNKSDLNVS